MKSDYRCGDCRHYNCERFFDSVCVNLGHLEGSIGCEQFKPNTKKLKDVLKEEPSALELLADIVSKVPANSLHVLSSLLYNEKTTRKFGYKFMQKVVVRYKGTGAAYVNNFIHAYVIEASKNGLRLLSPQGNTEIVLMEFTKGELSGPKIYSLREWKILKRHLVSTNKIDDPSLKRKKVSQDYLLEEKKSSKEKKEYKINDLVEIVKDVERGVAPSKHFESVKESKFKSGTYTLGE